MKFNLSFVDKSLLILVNDRSYFSIIDSSGLYVCATGIPQENIDYTTCLLGRKAIITGVDDTW